MVRLVKVLVPYEPSAVMTAGGSMMIITKKHVLTLGVVMMTTAVADDYIVRQ